MVGIRGTFEVILGQPIVIICSVTEFKAGTITLRDADAGMAIIQESRLTNRVLNNTTKEFTFTSSKKSDNGKMVACYVADFVSPVAIITIYCKC